MVLAFDHDLKVLRIYDLFDKGGFFQKNVTDFFGINCKIFRIPFIFFKDLKNIKKY